MLHTDKNLKSRLLYGAALAALTFSGTFPGGAYAEPSSDPQQAKAGAENTDDDGVIETIVVTGVRTSNQASIAVKRKSDSILDAAALDQIGLFPDLTVVQVARRIPGVSVVSTFGVENDRSPDSGESIVIRGIRSSFNLVTFDGVPIASTQENKRGSRIELIPPSVISRVEAIKTLDASLNPHALSGQLNLVTRSAFDQSGHNLSVRFAGGRNSTSGDVLNGQQPNLRADLMWTDTFGVNDEFGVTVSGSYHQFSSTNYELKPGARDDTYLFYPSDPASNDVLDNIADSNGMPAVRRLQIFAFEDERQRIAASGRLEYKPTGQTYLSLFAAFFEEKEEETRHEYLPVAQDDFRPTDQTLTSGQWPEARTEFGLVPQPEDRTTTLITGIVEHDFNEKSHILSRVSWSRATGDVIRNQTKFRGFYRPEGAFAYTINDGIPDIEFVNPDFVNDYSNYSNQYIRQRTQELEQKLFYGELSYDYNFGAGANGLGFEVGGAVTLRDQRFDREYVEGDVFNTVGCTEVDITDCPLVTFDQFVVPGASLAGWDSRVRFPFIDVDALFDAWNAQGRPQTSDRSDNSISDDYDLSEDIFGLFTQIGYRTDRLTVTAGVRYDRTNLKVNTFAEDESLDDDPNDAAAFVPQHRDADYDFFLPSLYMSYDLTDEIIVRAGYGRTIGRPNFGDYAASESIGEPDLTDPSDDRISIERGNPDLKPRISDNFDLSLEYYFDDGASAVHIAAFYKDISNQIFTQEQIIPNYEIDGLFYTAEVTQPVNAGKASLKGIEIGLKKDFAHDLPAPWNGFVVSGNVTYLDGKIKLPLPDGGVRTVDGFEKQPELLFNANIGYDTERFGIQIGYNWVGRYLTSINEESELYDVETTSRGQLDLQGRYKVSDNIVLIGEVQNLMAEGVTSVRPFEGGDLLASKTQRGRVIWLGFSYKY